MRATERRLSSLERARAKRHASIPTEQRWWLALAETESEREQWASEPVSWAEVEADWWAAAEVSECSGA